MAPDGPSPGGEPIFSRESVLGGMPARRASTLLYAIENRSALLTARSRSAMARFETERSLADREQLFLGALAEGRTPPLRPTIQDIDRHAGAWADLVPADPSLRAAIAKRLVDKYGLPGQAQGIRQALGAGDPAVEAAYARQADGASLSGAGRAPLRARERLRWMRAGVAARLESLPPFWLAYALTLTETVGGGILALPIALAAFGPLGATAVLVFFGIVNTLTVAALVEAITRNGNMRYGNAFFGRLIGDYLGRPGNLVAMPALFALDAVGFCVALVGFGITIGGVTGLPAAVCASLLFGVTLVILWRGSLDATVALAVAVGLLNLLLIVVLSLLALTHAQPSGSGPGTVFVLDASVLNLIFGVALVAYFGHTSAGHAAKVVLARDPGGRHLLAGNVAAMVTAMVVYVMFVLTVTAAVGPDALIGYDGTALTPLAERVGPVVDVIGTVYVTLAVGLSALYVGLGIFNQMAEVLDALPRRLPPASGAVGRLVAFALRASPLAVMFAIVVVMLDAGSISFTAPLSFIGTLTLPLLGGVFPVLLLVAARRRGGRLPARFIPALGHPVVAFAVGSIFLASMLVFGLWIWTAPLERLAALGVSAAIVGIVAVSWRRGAFRPRTVVEYRLEPGPPALGVLSVVSDGRALQASISLEEVTGMRSVTAAEAVVSSPGTLRRIHVSLPQGAAAELELWVHAVTPDGSSQPTPVGVEVDATGGTSGAAAGQVAASATTLGTGGHGSNRLVTPLAGHPTTLTISMNPRTAT